MPKPTAFQTLVEVSTVLALLLGSAAGPASAQQGPINTPEPGVTQAVAVAARAAAVRVRASSLQSARSAADTAQANAQAAAAAASVVDESKQPLAAQCLKSRENSHNPYSFGCYWTSLRANTPEAADEFFGGFKVGNAISLSAGNEQSALYTELLSDNLWISSRLGWARVGLSGQVSANEDSTETTATQFFQGGGNAVLYAALPVASYLNYVGTDNPALVRRIDAYVTTAVGADVPKMNSATSDPAGNFRAGLNVQGFWSAHAEVFRFFATANGSYVVGFSNSFYENLTGDEATGPRAGFLAGSATVGVDLAKVVRAGVRFSGATLHSISQKPQFTVQLLPKN
jgi:hypothetical protein